MSFLRQIFGGKSKATAGNGGALLRLRARVLNTPHAIDPAKLEVIASVLSDRIGAAELQMVPDDVEARAATPSGGVEHLESQPPVAVIAVHGTLVQRSGGLDALSGLTSYSAIRAAFDAALADPRVREIVLDIDSGGGEVPGCFDLVDHIAASRNIKPVTAIVNEYAASAAYAIASAATRIVAPRTSRVGSIGVIAMHVDQSAANEKDGFAVTHVTAGAHKADGTPHAPLADGAKADMQARVDAMYDVFVSTVARNRGIDEQAVRATEARVYLAADALALGLIDEVAPADAALEAIEGASQLADVAPADLPEAIPDELPVPDEDPEEAPVARAAVSLADVARPGAVVDLDAVVRSLTVGEAASALRDVASAAAEEAVAAERAKASEIIAVCEAFGVPDLARGLIAKGTSLEQARADALRLAAMNDTPTLSGVDPFAGAGGNVDQVFVAAVKRRNEERKRR